MISHFHHTKWYQFLTPWQKQLIEQSFELLAREKRMKSHFADYSFLVFPASKCYEGFLKKYLFELGFISEKVYEGKRFRIGRALNPDLPDRYKDEWWLYDDVSEVCGEKNAREIWNTWLTCRNRIFHFFPKSKRSLNLKVAEKRIEKVVNAMDIAVESLGNSRS